MGYKAQSWFNNDNNKCRTGKTVNCVNLTYKIIFLDQTQHRMTFAFADPNNDLE